MGKQFLLYDLETVGGDRSDKSDEENESAEEGEGDGEDIPAWRILVLTTRWNIELLCERHVWFVDRTFKTLSIKGQAKR